VISRNIWLAVLLPLLLGASSSIVGPSTPLAAQCAPDGEVEFVCGLESPEDVIRIPETPWVVVSSRISEDEGHIYVVNVRDHSTGALFGTGASETGASGTGDDSETEPGADVDFDTETWASCTGPPAATYQPHGIALRSRGGGAHTLYVVGHGPRESVEVYSLSLDPSGRAPSASWVGCVVAPEGVSLNSVTPLPDDAIAVTNFNLAGGELWEWSPSHGWSEVPGSEMSGPNGLVSSEDGRWLYVGGWGEQAVVRLSRGRDPVQRNAVNVGFHVDNVRWAPDGSLLAAGQDGPSAAAIGGCLNGGGCEGVSSRVVRTDPVSFESIGPASVEELVDYPSNDLLPFGTVAIQVGDEIWVGGIAGGDRIARFPLD